MRLCVPIPCFFRDTDFCDALRKTAELGFDCAETYGWKNLDLEAVRAVSEECGVELRSLCTTEFRMTSPEHRKLWLDGLRESCEAAVKVGASRLITQVGQDTGAERAVQHESIVSALKEAKPILDEYGIIIMLEPLNPIVDHKGYYLTTAAEAFGIIREVDHPLVKIVYDIYHQQVTEGNIIPNITENLDCIAHLHAAGHPGRHELWNGENNYNYIFDAVDRAGYKGAVGLEYNPLLDPIESLKEAIHRYRK